MLRIDVRASAMRQGVRMRFVLRETGREHPVGGGTIQLPRGSYRLLKAVLVGGLHVVPHARVTFDERGFDQAAAP